MSNPTFKELLLQQELVGSSEPILIKELPTDCYELTCTSEWGANQCFLVYRNKLPLLLVNKENWRHPRVICHVPDLNTLKHLGAKLQERLILHFDNEYLAYIEIYDDYRE